MSEEFNFGSEYAKSNRAACKLCKTNIGQSTLRLAIFVQSPFFDGKVPNWYHFECFFKKKIPTDVSTIKGYDSLRWDDQIRIKKKMGLMPIDDENTEKKSDLDSSTLSTSSNKENKKVDSVDIFFIEYAKSARSKCQKCNNRIPKDEIRLQIYSDGWYHLECFSNNKTELGFKYKPNEISGYNDLEETDQELVLKSIGIKEEIKGEKTGKRKIKNEPGIKEEPENKKIKTLEEQKEQLLRTQSEEYWKLKDSLNKEFYKDNFIKELLIENDQIVTVISGRDNLLDLLTDVMYFGPLEKCPECSNGQLINKGTAYKCTGQFTEWTKCFHKTQDPVRSKKFHINKELKDEFPFLKKFKFSGRQRLYAKTLEELENQVKIKVEPDSVDQIKKKQPLYKMNFTTTQKLRKKNPEIKLIIERLGGKFTTSLNEHTVALISNQEQLEKMGKKILESQNSDIHVIDEQILKDLTEIHREKINAEELILKHNISTWGSDLKIRIKLCIEINDQIIVNTTENKFRNKSGISGVVKMKIKGGAVVDPDSGLEDEAHILGDFQKSNEPFSCVLGLVDIMRGTNSYYKLQVIEHDKYKSKWYVFRSWGRVGTTIGGNKLTDYNKKSEALEEFFEQYLDKTGNKWEDRKISGKNPNRFYPLEMDYGDENEEAGVNSKINDKDFKSTSKLAEPIQDIIKLIFDIENMKRQMKEFEIDLNKMPLGKISANQIKSAFNILTELTELIVEKNKDTMILDASNRFYTLIPHDFGMRKPLILNNSKIIKEKTEMLNNLMEIEIAYNILKTGKDAEEDPIDAHFKKLKCSMNVLDKSSDEFLRLCKNVKNTHAETHSSYKLVVHEIIKINRESEIKDNKFSNLHNRKFLWHGSRLTNYAGILSQGLRIAPPEAPCTGYMFGKGVYFADMVSKSANYCFTNKNNPTGLMLLCEVALGDMYELEGSEYITKLPKGKHSTKGLGRTHPDPLESHNDLNNVELVMGKSVPNEDAKNSALLYNEYIVYDTAQVHMSYLFKMGFEYEDYDY